MFGELSGNNTKKPLLVEFTGLYGGLDNIFSATCFATYPHVNEKQKSRKINYFSVYGFQGREAKK